jgi:uroporphyrin-3 C-methyltransferase
VIACLALTLSVFQLEKYHTLNQTHMRQLVQVEDDLKSKMEDLDTQLTLVKEQSKHTPFPLNTAQWRRFEIESLLTIATVQYQNPAHLNAVGTLLTEAQQKLQAMADPQLKPLELALSQDLHALETLKVIDKQARCQQLSHIADQIAALSFSPSQAQSFVGDTPAMPSHSEPSTINASASYTASSSWQTVLFTSLKHLKDLVKIRRHTKPIEPLLSDVEQSLVQQQLRLLLEQSRVAILMSDQALYEHTLQAVLAGLEQNYHHQLEQIEPIKQSLASLRTQSVIDVLPPLSYPNQLSLLRLNS